MKRIVILGSTGSIGTQTLDIIRQFPNDFQVVGLAASSNEQTLNAQVAEFKVKNSVLFQRDGMNALVDLATLPEADLVVTSVAGVIGLLPTFEAIKAKKDIALASKEVLVAAGEVVMPLVQEYGVTMTPIDSEHSAIFQCVQGYQTEQIAELILTASGGPFRERKDMSEITVGEALSHPTWTMGPVVTINSATLVNKGLEIIEAHYLFDLPYSQIEAVIHPQSVVHSMVQYVDGSTIAQASPPNMKGPISFAINYPDRVKGATTAIDWTTSHNWSFSPIDNEKFPAIDLARRCGTLGGGLPAIFNAANEVCVAAFIDGKIGFTSIIETVEEVVQSLGSKSAGSPRDLADVSAIENDARKIAQELLMKVAR